MLKENVHATEADNVKGVLLTLLHTEQTTTYDLLVSSFFSYKNVILTTQNW